MRHLFWCAVLLGGACERKQPAPEEFTIPEDPPIPEEIVVGDPFRDLPDLTLWQLHVIARGSPVATDIDVRLSGGGRLEISERDRWRPASLDDFSRRLEQSKGLRYDEANGVRVPGIFVGIDVHSKAPWLHLGWLLTVCGEHQVYKLQIRVGERTLRLYLPWDAAIEHTEPPPHVHVTVELRADGYRIGKRRVGFDHVVRHLEEAVRTAEKPDLLVCAPVMAADVPVERVLDVFAACLDKGIPRLDFSCWIPRKEDRRVDVLRRPERGR